MMMSVLAVDLMTKIVLVAALMMTNLVENAVSTTAHAADLTTTNLVVATAVMTTVLVAVTMTKKNRAVAAKAMSARKTRCMTARKPLAKSA
jgi:hypothetical protein